MPCLAASAVLANRTGFPSSSISPAVELLDPGDHLVGVDLPAPFSPTNALTAPSARRSRHHRAPRPGVDLDRPADRKPDLAHGWTSKLTGVIRIGSPAAFMVKTPTSVTFLPTSASFGTADSAFL